MTTNMTNEITQVTVCATASLIIVGWLAMIALLSLPV